MNIVNYPPPNWDELKAAFPDIDFEHVIVTYAPNVHTKYDMPDHLVGHEGVHIKQQEAYPGGAAGWWARNLSDPAFRLEQEIEAYREQVRIMRATIGDRNRVTRYISKLAADLSGPMYGGLITHSAALRAISGVA